MSSANDYAKCQDNFFDTTACQPLYQGIINLKIFYLQCV